MNCAALAWGDATIAIDCGVGFIDELGADMVHPNFGWLYEQGERLRAIVVTHGHEDHIGALPYFLKRFRVPVYAPPYAAALIQDRLAEHRLEDVELRVGAAGSRFKIGPFGIELFSQHLLVFEMTSVLILIAIVGAVHLSLQARRTRIAPRPSVLETPDSPETPETREEEPVRV